MAQPPKRLHYTPKCTTSPNCHTFSPTPIATPSCCQASIQGCQASTLLLPLSLAQSREPTRFHVAPPIALTAPAPACRPCDAAHGGVSSLPQTANKAGPSQTCTSGGHCAHPRSLPAPLPQSVPSNPLLPLIATDITPWALVASGPSAALRPPTPHPPILPRVWFCLKVIYGFSTTTSI